MSLNLDSSSNARRGNPVINASWSTHITHGRTTPRFTAMNGDTMQSIKGDAARAGHDISIIKRLRNFIAYIVAKLTPKSVYDLLTKYIPALLPPRAAAANPPALPAVGRAGNPPAPINNPLDHLAPRAQRLAVQLGIPPSGGGEPGLRADLEAFIRGDGLRSGNREIQRQAHMLAEMMGILCAHAVQIQQAWNALPPVRNAEELRLALIAAGDLIGSPELTQNAELVAQTLLTNIAQRDADNEARRLDPLPATETIRLYIETLDARPLPVDLEGTIRGYAAMDNHQQIQLRAPALANMMRAIHANGDAVRDIWNGLPQAQNQLALRQYLMIAGYALGNEDLANPVHAQLLVEALLLGSERQMLAGGPVGDAPANPALVGENLWAGALTVAGELDRVCLAGDRGDGIRREGVRAGHVGIQNQAAMLAAVELDMHVNAEQLRAEWQNLPPPQNAWELQEALRRGGRVIGNNDLVNNAELVAELLVIRARLNIELPYLER